MKLTCKKKKLLGGGWQRCCQESIEKPQHKQVIKLRLNSNCDFFKCSNFIFIILTNNCFSLQTKSHDLWYEAKKKIKVCKRKRFSMQDDMVVWRHFRPQRILEAIWDAYIQNMMFEHLIWWSQSSGENQTKKTHGFITTHTDRSILFILHVKQISRLCFYKFFQLIIVLYKNI